jgi:hypothetical protein
MNDRQKQTSLKYLLNEVVSGKKIKNRQFAESMKYISMNEQDISNILDSGIFTKNESFALNVLFSKTKTSRINETIISKLDRSVKIISESKPNSKVLSEGFFGDIWDGLKNMGDKAKDALVGGWSKLKAIWGEFKELTQELVNNMSEGFGKAIDWAKGEATSFFNQQKQKAIDAFNASLQKMDDINEKKKLGADLGHAYETGQWVVTKFKEKVSSPKATWFNDVLSGKGNPEAPSDKLDDTEVQDGFEELKQEEGINSKRDGLIRERNQFFSNYDVVKNLYEMSVKRLNEGGGAAHLEDAVSNPVLKNVIHWGINLLQYALIPIAKFGQKLAETAANKFLNNMSGVVKFFGGPGQYAFPVIALIFAEIIEIVIKNKTAEYSPAKLGLKLAEFLVPGLKPIIITAKGILTALKTFLLIWTIGNILFNLVLSARKVYTDSQKQGGNQTGGEQGSEPEVQTAGYKPKGSFKLKEGKLVFVQ